MSASRTERLLNLVICLLATRRWLTKEQIRAAVPQYGQCGSTEAFERMFERDKEDLRELGVPVVTGTHDAWFEDEVGYRIDREAYALPEVSFTPSELAVLGLASRVWQQASLAGPASRALVKLRSLGIEPDNSALVALEPRVRTSEPAFEPLYAAARDRASVSFSYRTSGTGAAASRRVQPWAITSWHGRWYLLGHDLDRGAARVFRLSRVQGLVRRVGEPGGYQVPADLDARAMVQGLVREAPQSTARLRVRRGTGQALRLRAEPEPDDSEPASRASAESAGEVVRVTYTDAEAFADEVVGYGSDVVVLDPPELRDAVVRRLRAAVTALAHAAPVDDGARAAPVDEAVP